MRIMRYALKDTMEHIIKPPSIISEEGNVQKLLLLK